LGIGINEHHGVAEFEESERRIVRPTVPLPRDRAAEVGPPVAAEAGRFRGWMQIGFWERELIEEDRWSNGIAVTVRSGVAGGTPSDQTQWPWAVPRGIFRWHRQQVSAVTTTPTSNGPLAEWWYQQDSTAWEVGLTLRSDVRELLELAAAPLPGPLDLVDAEGEVGAAYRVWRMRPFNYDYHPTTAMLTGAALFLRPDLRALLEETFDPLVGVTRVEREQLTAPADGVDGQLAAGSGGQDVLRRRRPEIGFAQRKQRATRRLS
jgi:hypothetical protein